MWQRRRREAGRVFAITKHKLQIKQISTNLIDNGLYNFFVDSFSNAFNNLKLPYVFYQTNAVVAYVQKVGTSMISVYKGNISIAKFLFDRSNVLLTVTLLTPTLLVLGVTLIYALVNTASKYGIEKVKIFVSESSLALIINVRDNTQDVLKNIVIFIIG